ncbi:hypothetical protein D6D15_09260 [Aureobasidium pullulans]|uniref:Uncharacterized protein n=1 Tax=Aureobasidium pullulans TaxID=5580 RepID=A0A4S9AUR2_AURPU|nr:hypothetical protein D6D15_09260 [Aureobasidium pullulans]
MSQPLSLESSMSPEYDTTWKPPTFAVLKRSYDMAIAEEVEATNKRRKIEAQKHCQDGSQYRAEDDPMVSPDVVIIKKSSRIVAHVPLVNLKTFAPHIYSEITIDAVYEGHQVPLFIPRAYTSAMGLRRWALWLETHHIGHAMGGPSAPFATILDTFGTANSLGHEDFKDAIMDYLMVRIFHGSQGSDWVDHASAGCVRDNLRQLGKCLGNATSNCMLEKLVKNLVLHYDPEGALEQDIYPKSIKTAVTAYVLDQWRYKDGSGVPAKVSTETPTEEWSNPPLLVNIHNWTPNNLDKSWPFVYYLQRQHDSIARYNQLSLPLFRDTSRRSITQQHVSTPGYFKLTLDKRQSAMSSPATKRSSDGDGSAEKRLKTEDQEQTMPVYDLGVVLLKNNRGDVVTHVPLVNFKTYASSVVKDLKTQIMGEYNLTIYTYKSGPPLINRDIRTWADWLVKRDIKAALGGESSSASHADSALWHAQDLGDVDYQDALIDFFVEEFQSKNDPTKLDIPRFRSFMSSRWAYSLHIIPEVLILHHDAKATATGQYSPAIRQRVSELAFKHFSAPDECPKDPLSLTAEELCKTYHQHHKRDLPCYKTQKLPNTSE